MKPCLLTPERQERILEAIRTGVTMKAAANYAGIAEWTLHDWRARGRHYRAFLDSQDGGGDQLAERLWRDGRDKFMRGDVYGAYMILADLDSRLDRSEERKFMEFDEAVAKTVAELKMRLSGTVARAAFNGDWKAALAMLKSRWPEEYSERRIAPSETDTEADIERKHAALRDLLEAERRRRVAANGSG